MTTTRTLLPLALLALPLVACGSRSTTLLDAGGPRAEGAPLDRVRPVERPGPPHDSGVPDRPRSDGLSTFCGGGQPKLEWNGVALAVQQLKTGTAVMASCCGPGELLRFLSKDANGKAKEVAVEIIRFPNAASATHIDVAQLPAGWGVAVRCDSSDKCSLLRFDNASLSGSIDYAPLGAIPGAHLDLCITVQATAGSAPGFSSARLYAQGALVNMACVLGMDQSCNHDPAVSSLKGTCNDDSTCSCAAGATKVPASGKCQ